MTTNEDKAKEIRRFITQSRMPDGTKGLDKLSRHNKDEADLENIYKIAELSAIKMAEWKDEQLGWHDAKKEQPPMDEEVIVLTNVLNGKELSTPRRICFGHIVDKEICVDYDGWNIPGVAYWMYDPKLKEDKKS